jgi:integrase
MSQRVQRHVVGSVRFDKRRRTWNYLWYEAGKRRSKMLGTKAEYPTKAAAWKAVRPIEPEGKGTPLVRALLDQFRRERMPKRYSTRRAYESWFRNHILPAWGDHHITDLQARPVELWLASRQLSPKSRVHVRNLVRELWDFAMWAGHVPIERNPMELVTIKGATKRTRRPRSLTVEEFHRFIQHLGEPFRTLTLVCVCFGLRISECLALKWSDVDWLNGKLKIERGIVRQHVDDVKTAYSGQLMTIDAGMLDVLKTWKQSSQFSAEGDWIFASPVQLGRLPWSYPHILRVFHKAADLAEVGNVATHTMRHSFRSWLDSVGTGVGVQRQMMRHASITTTMDTYGQVVTDEMVQAHGKVVGLALNGAQTERKPS